MENISCKKLKSVAYNYLKIRKERTEYLGEKYFRFSFDEEKVTEVCVSNGKRRRGKCQFIGVYVINKTTFFSNYLAINYVEPCSKKEFDNKFELITNCLK